MGRSHRLRAPVGLKLTTWFDLSDLIDGWLRFILGEQRLPIARSVQQAGYLDAGFGLTVEDQAVAVKASAHPAASRPSVSG